MTVKTLVLYTVYDKIHNLYVTKSFYLKTVELIPWGRFEGIHESH